MNDKISIIIPIYNVEKYIHRCVDSVLAQTYHNTEIILVDDGSLDRCGKICDEYAKIDKRIKVVHKENGGLSDARNAGIEVATGDYIGFVDSDDYISEDMYEKLYSALINNNADMSICSFKYVGEDITAKFDNDNSPIKNGVLSGSSILFEKMNEQKFWYWVVAWNKLYKRELFSDIRFPVGKINEDEFIIHHILLKCDNVACVSDMLYYYVQREGSIMNIKYSVKNLDLAEAFMRRSQHILNSGYKSMASYNALMRGIIVLVKGYSRCRKDDGAKERYKELKKLYRKISQKNFCINMSIKNRIYLAVDYVCPYYAERLKSKLKTQ